jgi:hypothetical protein
MSSFFFRIRRVAAATPRQRYPAPSVKICKEPATNQQNRRSQRGGHALSEVEGIHPLLRPLVPLRLAEF